jgi:enterochelin esterase-like enzyme
VKLVLLALALSSLILLLPIMLVHGQTQPPPAPIISPEVHNDNRVTFRFRAPNAKQVSLELEGAQPVLMQKDDQGVWTLTTDKLEPDFYGYMFIVDGVRLMDPRNQLMQPNLVETDSEVHVPGPPSLSWEVNPVPHGVIHHHFYRSAIVGDERDFFVYTPPGYDANSKKLYPVLYLLHGFSDDAGGWTSVGRANVILDNLLAQGKARPMLVVMPLGYGAPEILSGGDATYDPFNQRNIEQFGATLLTEVIPQVENSYRADKKRDARAITGLSMGGEQALFTGLNHLDTFAAIGGFSSGLTDQFVTTLDAQFPGIGADINSKLRLLWIACGVDDDRFIVKNRKLGEWLKSKGVRVTEIETPGQHTWMVWRRNLTDFVPLLFR